MFLGKRIKDLEKQLEELKSSVFALEAKVKEFCEKVDALAEKKDISVAEEASPAPKQKRQRRSSHYKPKNNGKEGSEATE